MRVINQQLIVISVVMLAILSGCTSTTAPSPEVTAEPEPRVAEQPIAPVIPDVDKASLFKEALRYQKQKQWPVATELWRQQVAEAPAQTSAWHNLAICLRQQKQWLESEQAIAKALLLAPESSKALNEQAYIFRKQGKFAAAEASYIKAIATGSAEADIYVNLGILYDLYLRQPQDAIAQYKAYIGFQPNDAKVQQWLRVLISRYGEGE